MELLKTRFTKKTYVANSKKRRVSPKFDCINTYNHKKVFVAACRDYYSNHQRKSQIIIWDKKEEKRLNFGPITEYRYISEDMFAVKSEGKWLIYNEDVVVIRRDITYFFKCKDADYYIITVDDLEYFADLSFRIISDPFLEATDFDEYGYSIVQDPDTKKYSVMSREFLLELAHVECEELTALSKDFFRIRRNGKYGVMDKAKRIIVPCAYDRIQWQRHNHFELLFNRKLGLANTKGEIVFECLYDEIMETPDKFVVRDFAKLESSKTLEAAK